ncbi:uncharacterized protein LOC111068883 [Drosophila obscura]|uniref:uncharacterized protein LOC111068883 n=1 Tax=Drosophila obscura TaxID=7282 RepID=UPI001BB20BE7|nr:uncharacterized protein LOC111068883 [Drosophila obscura]
MPQKVLTRRQRKAAEAMRQYTEETLKYPEATVTPRLETTVAKDVKAGESRPEQQIIPGGPPPPAPPKPPISARKKIVPISRATKLTQKRTQSNKLVESIIYSKTPVASGRLPKKTPETVNFDTQQLPGANLQTTGATSATEREAFPKTAAQQHAREQLVSIWNKIQNHMSSTTMSTRISPRTVNIPLMNKICEQIKSRWQGILPEDCCNLNRQTGVSPGLSSLSFTPSEMELIPQTLQAVDNYLASIESETNFDDHDRRTTSRKRRLEREKAAYTYPPVKSADPTESVKNSEKVQTSISIRPDDSIKIIDQTGYLVVSGTDQQLAKKLIDMKAQGATIEQSIMLPKDTVERVLQQLEELHLNREQIIQKMHSKHETLAQRREPRLKKRSKKA